MILRALLLTISIAFAMPLLGTVQKNLGPKKSLSSIFYVKAKFPLKIKRSKIVAIIYGNDNYGFFSTTKFRTDKKSIRIGLVPPGYRYKINFFAETNNKRIINIGTKKFLSPVPKKYKVASGYLKHGRFTANFFLLSGALQRAKFWNKNALSRNPERLRRSSYRYTFAVILNRIGEIVWIHVPIDRREIFDTYIAAKPLGGGRYGILLGKKSGYFQKVNYKGETIEAVRSRDLPKPFTMHHDFLTASKSSIYAISSRAANVLDRRARKYGKSFLSDIIIKIDLDSGKHKKVVDFLKYYKPKNNSFWTGDDVSDHKFVSWDKAKVDFDFLHLNAIQKLDEGFLVGIRNLNKVVLMSPNFKKIKWSMGWDQKDTFTIKKKRNRFSHMHTPLRKTNGNVVLFDNGFTRESSRILEYELDYNNNEAKLVWSYEPKPKLYSKDRGSIALLRNKNILAYFVNPTKNKRSLAKPVDIMSEIDRRHGVEKARMERRFDVLSPGYRAIPLATIGEELFIGDNL